MEESVRIMKSWEREQYEAILLGDSFINAKNLYMSLDSADRFSIIEVLIAERDRLWCRVALSIMVYCIVWYLVPSNGDIGTPAFHRSIMFGMFSFGFFWPLITIFAILGIHYTLRVKKLRNLTTDRVGDFSDVQNWKFLILPDSRESQIVQIECDDEDHHDQVRDDVIEEITIRINKNVPLRRSPVYSAKERW